MKNDLFSYKEKLFLHYLSQGLGIRKIAACLEVKHCTAQSYKNRLFGKTGTFTMPELAEYAKRNGYDSAGKVYV